MATVLVIEDDGTLTQLVTDLLERAGTQLRRYRIADADGLSAAGDSHAAHGISPSLFRFEGECWTIRHAGRSVCLRDTRGLHYLALLLRNPGQALPALELAARLDSAPETRSLLCELADPLTDGRALAAYRRRAMALEEEIADATACNDLGRLAAAREELEAIVDHLHEASGSGGRARRMPSAAERARQAVTKGIWNAVHRIGRSHACLARHLTASVKTGYLCEYRPDPQQRVAWEL